MKRFFQTIIFLCMLLAGSIYGVAAQGMQANQLLDQARQLYQMGKYVEAHNMATKIITAADNHLIYMPVAITEAEFIDAMCQAQMGSGIAALADFVSSHPAAIQTNLAMVALGSEYFEEQMWAQALECFDKVNTRELEDSRMEQFCFEYGYAAYKTDDKRLAREWLRRLDSGDKTYYPHARYLLGYISYTEGLLVDSKLHFGAVVNHDDYKVLVPYYLLNIEYLSGNDKYVAERADGVLLRLAGPRRAEVERVAAQSNFRLQKWSDAERYVAMLAEEGATLSREEHYIGGYSLYRLEEFDRAAQYLRAACGPNDQLTQNAAYHLADCCLRTENKKQAIQSFSMAYSSGDNKTIREDALYNYCKLQVESGGGNFDEEIQSLKHYLHEYPRSAHRAEIEGYLITACYDANDLKGAYETLKEFSSSGGGKIREAMQTVAYYYAAQCYMSGELKEAEEYCNLSLDLADYDADIEALAVYLLGEIDYSQGKWASAAAMYDQYLRLNRRHQPEYLFALYNMGYARFNNGRYAIAYDDFADFVDERTTNDSFRADSFNRLGDIEAVAKNYEEASALYARSAAMDVDERFYGAYRAAMMEGLAGNTDKRVEALRAIINEGRGSYVVKASYELGNTLLRAGRYDEAVEALENFTKTYTSSTDYVAALSDLGLAYRNVGNDEAALKTYKRVVARTKGSIVAQNAMEEIRNIYVERNEVDNYFAYTESVGIKSKSGDERQRDSLSFVAAQRLYIAGNKSEASEAFDKYLVENPEGAYSAAALYYAADCRVESGDKQGAMKLLDQLTAMYYNSYTQRAYEKMAQIAASMSDYGSAAQAYKNLVEVGQSPSKRREALDQYMDAVISGGASAEEIIEAADWVLASTDVSPQIVRKARMQKAKALEASGKRNPAVAIYSDLSQDVSNVEGAESAYKIIETAFQFGSFEKAESLVYEFADKGTPHTYWLAKSFLLLGDVYVSRGDLFQARATYQSVVDGYAGGEDGIVEQAKERIENLQ